MRRPLSIVICAATFAGAASLGAQSTRAKPSNSRSTHLTQPTEAIRTQTADQQVLQALNRLGFGPRPGDVAAVRKMGVDAWIDQQLHPEKIDDGAMEQLVASAYPVLGQDQAKLAAGYAAAQREVRQIKRADAADTANAMNGANARPEIPPELREAQRERQQLGAELASSRVARAVGSNRQLQEVMTDFWENHFSVYARKNAVEPYYLADYDRTIREHALGKFRDLLGAVAHSPAMLVYLDNALSRANPGQPTLAPERRGPLAQFGPNGPTDADVETIIAQRRLNPMQAMQLRQRVAQFRTQKQNAAKQPGGLNENYGRELMELHTLGVDGGYTQKDVIEVARALTGWSVRPPAQGGGFIFRPEWHDTGDKTILGQHFPAGRAEDEGERVLDMLARSPATAHHIAFELCQRFVSDSPSTALVDRATQTYLGTDGDIREVVRTIVTSPEFFSTQAYHAKVKSPFEVVVSAARALGAAPDTTARTAFAVQYLGEPLFGHEEPNGWPETGESWMSTGGILNRINFGMAVAANRLPGATVMGVPGADTLQRAPRAEQVDGVVTAILGGAASPDTRKILESGEHPLAAAAQQSARAMTDDTANGERMGVPGGMVRVQANGNNKQGGLVGARGAGRNAIVGAVPQLDGFAQVVGLALGSPEFQRR